MSACVQKLLIPALPGKVVSPQWLLPFMSISPVFPHCSATSRFLHPSSSTQAPLVKGYVVTVVGPHSFSGMVHSHGRSRDAASSVAAEKVVVSSCGRSLEADSFLEEVQGEHQLVASWGEIGTRNSPPGAPCSLFRYTDVSMIMGGGGGHLQDLTAAYILFCFEEDCRSVTIKAHKVRKIATILLFRRDFVIQQTVRVGTLSSQSTFSAFYLRDVTHWNVDLFHQPCGGGSRDCVAQGLFQPWFSNSCFRSFVAVYDVRSPRSSCPMHDRYSPTLSFCL